ncbi:MAG: right-handed parallel beta-helix repeat-containing protein [bacterium]|nr:right-handed parallel beta-helix repeat-containing protein [bacterium]
MNVRYNLVQGGYVGFGNIDGNPSFVRDANDGGDGWGQLNDDFGDFRLRCDSPCLNEGTNSPVGGLPATDIAGNPRIIDGSVDMGVFEGSYQAFVVGSTQVTVPEGSTGAFTVALACDPAGSVNAGVEHLAGDTDITITSGASLAFNPGDYDVPQTVDLAAATDPGFTNDLTQFRVHAPGIPETIVQVAEADSDAAPSRVYVDMDATGADTGTTWVNAFTELATALNAARDAPGIGEIWVAGGSTGYLPDVDPVTMAHTGDRLAAFDLVDGVAINGGFGGVSAQYPAGETQLDQRDPAGNETILTGDLAGDDGPAFLHNEDNSVHVVIANNVGAGTRLDGFTISGGHADGTGIHELGAGVFIQSGSLKVAECRIISNEALGDGGGLYAEGDSTSLAIERCTFLDNAARYGAGIYTSTAHSLIVASRFHHNNTRGWGGGVYARYGNPVLTQCVVSGNSGGGVRIYQTESATITNCTVSGNQPDGLLEYDSDYVAVSNCIFWGNYTYTGDMDESSQLRLTGGTPPTHTVIHCCIQGLTANFDHPTNTGDDPRFIHQPFDPGDGLEVGDNDDLGDLHLAAGSAAIDAGDNDADTDIGTSGIQALPAIDLDGNPRFVDDPVAPDAGVPPVVDIGAFEYQADCNTNGVIDSVDIDLVNSLDCNSNGVPDECESPADCNTNLVQDVCEIGAGPPLDCNLNYVLDECDLADGTDDDFNTNGVPDRCERSLEGYWRFQFGATGCYEISNYLYETRYLRFDANSELIENWIETGGQYLKINYPSVEGPSYRRFRFEGTATADTDRYASTERFIPLVGVVEIRETVECTAAGIGERGRTEFEGTLHDDDTISGTWFFGDSQEGGGPCGLFDAQRVAEPPPLPAVIDLEMTQIVLESAEIGRFGAFQVTQRDHRVRYSFLSDPVEVRYLLSLDQAADGFDEFIGSETIQPGGGGMLGPHSGPGPKLDLPACIPPADQYYVVAVIDAADVLPETDEGNNVTAVPVTISPPPLPADFDCDGDVDLDDFEAFEECLRFSGPMLPPPSDECLDVFDLDADLDVDLADFAHIQVAF